MVIKHNINNNNIVEIEITADKLCYTIIGTKQELQLFINSMIKQENNKIYIIAKLIVPVSNIADEESINRNIIINVNKDVEYIQCSIMCDCKLSEEKKIYSLMYIEKDKLTNSYYLKYPEIELNNGNDPEKIIIHTINNLFDSPHQPLLHMIEKNLKLIDITGKNEDVLIYSTRISINKKYYKKKY
jgi:hypothetical protein